MSAVLPSPAAAPLPAAKSMSPNQRAWARFRRNRIGYVSLWLLRRLAGARHLRRAGQQRPAAGGALPGRAVFPAVQEPPRDHLRRRLRHAHRLAGPAHRRAVRQARQLGLLHAEPATPRAPATTSTVEPESGAAERDCTGWAPTAWASDMVARLLYGFRVSIWFAFALTLLGTVHRHRRRRAAGLLRRARRPGRCSASSRSGARCRSCTC